MFVLKLSDNITIISLKLTLTAMFVIQVFRRVANSQFEMQKYPALFFYMFVNEQRPLQAKDLSSLFYVNFSPQGSNRRAKENQTICYWRDWLIDVEGIVVTLL